MNDNSNTAMQVAAFCNVLIMNYFKLYILSLFYNGLHAPVLEEKVERTGIHPLYFSV